MNIFIGCRSISDKDLYPIDYKNKVFLPSLTPIVNKDIYQTTYIIPTSISAPVNNSIKRDINNDAELLLARNISQNFIFSSDKQIQGFIRSQTKQFKIKNYYAYTVISCLTVFTLNLFGFPTSTFQNSQELRFDILNCKEEIIKTYTIHEKNKRAVGFFSKGIRGDIDYPRYDALSTYKKGLKQLNELLFRDQYEILQALKEAQNSLSQEQILAQQTIKKTNKSVNRGQQQVKQGMYDDAIKTLNAVIKKEPYHAYALFYRSMAYYNKGEYASALEDAKRAAMLIPELSDAHFYKAVAAIQLHQYDYARTYINQAIAANDRNEDYRVISGSLYEIDNYLSKAKEEYQIALAINPNRNDIHDYICRTELKIQEQQEKKYNQKMQRLEAAAIALQATGTALNATNHSINPTRTATNPSNTRVAPNISKKKTCSMCNGTGKNPAKERPAFYSYSNETFSNPPCEICGDRSNHYHKDCPSCRGKGVN